MMANKDKNQTIHMCSHVDVHEFHSSLVWMVTGRLDKNMHFRFDFTHVIEQKYGS